MLNDGADWLVGPQTVSHSSVLNPLHRHLPYWLLAFHFYHHLPVSATSFGATDQEIGSIAQGVHLSLEEKNSPTRSDTE